MTPAPEDIEIRELRIRLDVLRIAAASVEERSARRRWTRPRPRDAGEAIRFRNRDYAARAYAKRLRLMAAPLFARLREIETRAAVLAQI